MKLLQWLLLMLVMLPGCVFAEDQKALNLWIADKGVLCDKYICADARGISVSLTEKYRGKIKSDNLQRIKNLDLSSFTFSTGIHCDVKERLCQQVRYYDNDKNRDVKLNIYYTKVLFGSY